MVERNGTVIEGIFRHVKVSRFFFHFCKYLFWRGANGFVFFFGERGECHVNLKDHDYQVYDYAEEKGFKDA